MARRLASANEAERMIPLPIQRLTQKKPDRFGAAGVMVPHWHLSGNEADLIEDMTGRWGA